MPSPFRHPVFSPARRPHAPSEGGPPGRRFPSSFFPLYHKEMIVRLRPFQSTISPRLFLSEIVEFRGSWFCSFFFLRGSSYDSLSRWRSGSGPTPVGFFSTRDPPAPFDSLSIPTLASDLVEAHDQFPSCFLRLSPFSIKVAPESFVLSSKGVPPPSHSCSTPHQRVGDTGKGT